jgi:hypothetical protein
MFIIFTTNNNNFTIVDLVNQRMANNYADSFSSAVKEFKNNFDYSDQNNGDATYTITDTKVFDEDGDHYGTITHRFDSIESLIDQYPEEFI